jgi:hypothetical protein
MMHSRTPGFHWYSLSCIILKILSDVSIGKYYICYFDWRQFTHAYGSSGCESSRWRVMLEIRDSIDEWGYDLDTWVNYRRWVGI